MALSAPEPLGTQHQIGDFNSGVASLDEWLKRRVIANQASGAARIFVVCEESKIVGYYALASGAVNVAADRGASGAICQTLSLSLCLRAWPSIGHIRAAASAGRSYVMAQDVLCMRPMPSASAGFWCMLFRQKPRRFISVSALICPQ